jgi:hypothetical protein
MINNEFSYTSVIRRMVGMIRSENHRKISDTHAHFDRNRRSEFLLYYYIFNRYIPISKLAF